MTAGARFRNRPPKRVIISPVVTEDEGPLRVLAADEDETALRRTAAQLEELGHTVTSFAVDVSRVGEQVLAEDPDLAVVVLHDDDEHALGLIGEISSYANGPVITLVSEADPEFIAAAASRGVDAYARAGSVADLASAIAVARARYAEASRLSERVDRLEGAFERRAVIERAKGILMERHGLDDRAAFERLRSHARANNRTVVDTARSVVEGDVLPTRR